ncbi:type IV pilus assembly protein PilM [Gloeobacter kilaueensis]|uniref:Type IV pilus assembly protein PilM n=1 Tax=Gloeobacter kilaueensis (strain ATCC BAA-2537 / CCAP 1431/1 / ULC 316 / JS1) TaxID=1183438 RepID=U5QEY5_GLOK1|nr:type IV pilus assembly protein PilM [Gloeobacter kilaueensis]AGY57481.1 type IV pilus assembly protein PilM [Gloeobacter kilaueensis JS1]
MTSVLASLFGNREGLGIEVTPEQTTIAQLENSGGRLRLRHLLSAATPAGAIVDGRVEDPRAVAATIQDLMATARLKARPVATAIPAREAVIRLFNLPADLQGAELRAVVLNQEAELYLPYPREEAYVDFQPLEAFVDPGGVRRQEILLVAAQYSVVNSYTEAIRRAGLEVAAVDIASFALTRALQGELQRFSPEEAVALVVLQADSTEINILFRGICQFSRTVSLGTWELRQLLERSKLLKPAGAAERQYAQEEALRRVLLDLAEEIRRSLDFYQAQGEGVPRVAQVLLAGSGADIPRLDQFLSQRLLLPVSRVDPLSALALPAQSVGEPYRAGVGAALGLGARSLKFPEKQPSAIFVPEINFLKDTAVAAASNGYVPALNTATEGIASIDPLLIAAAVPLVSLAVVAALSLIINAQVSSKEATLAELDGKITLLDRQLADVRQLKSDIEAERRRVEAVVDLFDLSRPWSAVLEDLRRRVPKGLWIESLESSHTKTGDTINIQGEALRFEEVAAFQLTLKDSPFIADAQLEDADKKDAKDARPATVAYKMQVRLNARKLRELMTALEQTGSAGLLEKLRRVQQEKLVR